MSAGHDPGSTIRRALRGEQVLDELIAEELPRLRAFVRTHLPPQLRLRESSSDLVQSVCRSMLVDRGRFEFRSEPEFRAWLFTVARTKILEKLRFHGREMRDVGREQRLDDSAASAILGAYQTSTTPSQVAQSREQVAILERAIDELEPDHREILTLVRLAGLPYPEAAVVMGRTPDAARMLLGRALIKLAEVLRRSGIGADTAPPR